MKIATLARPYACVEAVRQKWYPRLDRDALRVLAAAWLANEEVLGFADPLWFVLVAPPSSLKTVAIVALADATDGYILDTLTPNTFLSGYSGEPGKKASLLHRLGQRPNVFIKDFSGILEKKKYDRNEILGQLRQIWDGRFCKPTGSGEGQEEWKGRMRLIIGMTPTIDVYAALHTSLGERFLGFRYSVADGEQVELALSALRNRYNGDQARKEMVDAFREAIELAKPHLRPLDLGDVEIRLANLTAFVTRARAGVIRDSYRTDEVLIEPAPEGTPRLVLMLSQLVHGLVALRGTDKLAVEDYRIVERVAFASIPEPTGKILTAVYDHGARTVSDVEEHVKVSKSTIRRRLEDLSLVGLIDVHKAGSGRLDEYEPSVLGLDWLGIARLERAGPFQRIE